VSNNLWLVFSKPPVAVSWEHYDGWYDRHAEENLLPVPGLLSVTRYEVIPGADEPGDFRHLSLYQYEGEMEEWMTEVRGRMASGTIALPDWFDQIKFGSWDCAPLEPRVDHVRPGPTRDDAAQPTNLYLVFSTPPDGFSWPEYDRWYGYHVREHILRVPGFLSASRFEVTPWTDKPGGFRHLSVYEYEGEMDAWMTDLVDRMDTGVIELPEWFPAIRFGSWDCRPLGPRIEANAPRR
jgi:hypothetical protein